MQSCKLYTSTSMVSNCGHREVLAKAPFPYFKGAYNA